MTREKLYDWLHEADQITRESRVPEDTKKYMNETSITQSTVYNYEQKD